MKGFKNVKAFGLVMVLGVILLAAGTASAQIVTLTDGNSTARIDTTPTSQAGMFNWTVDGTNQLYQQWFWYRIGSAGGELGINALSSPVVNTFGSSFASLEYAGANGLDVKVQYILSGGSAGSHTSDISEIITIKNTGTSAMDLHFFQYSDFDLNGVLGQTATMLNANTVRQSGGGTILSETVATPAPNFHEVNLFANTLNSLNDGSPTTLNGQNTATGDATWAFQWDKTIASGGTFIISKDKNLAAVPEPGTLILLGMGLFGLGVSRKARQK